MSVANNNDDGRPFFLDFCAKVRNNDPSILPEAGKPFRIRNMCESEGIELADALLQNTSVTYLELETEHYTSIGKAEAMAKYIRTSKHLRHIRWLGDCLEFQNRQDIFTCFLRAMQDSTSLLKLEMNFSVALGGPSKLAIESMLKHSKSLRSLTLICQMRELTDILVAAGAAAKSELKKNITLRELTLEIPKNSAFSETPTLSIIRYLPQLRKLRLNGCVMNLTGLETVMLSDTCNITELEIHKSEIWLPIEGLRRVLRALARRPTLTKLTLHRFDLGWFDARLLRMTLCKMSSLHTLVLKRNELGSARLASLAPALYHNTSIQVLDLSWNKLDDVKSARLLSDILFRNKTITSLDLSGNKFGYTAGAVDCIAEGLSGNSTLLEIHFSCCELWDAGAFTLAEKLGSQKSTTLQKLTLDNNTITSTGLRVLLETMAHRSKRITELDLQNNPIGDEGASLLARSLGNNALPNLTRLSLVECGIGDDGFIALVSALEQNNSLLRLNLRGNFGFSKRPFLALAESLPEIEGLQRIDLNWSEGLGSAMPSLLAGLRKNTSLFCFHIEKTAPYFAPLLCGEAFRFAGGWMQEMECVGYRNRCLTLMRVPKDRLPPRCVWSHALAQVATRPDVIFEVLRSQPNLVPSKDTRLTGGIDKVSASVHRC
jgi:Ran GTPase-activating protein (RanGAP) involved in mRNA processing and transport